MVLDMKYCKRCGRPYDYPKCPYCAWTKKEKKKEDEVHEVLE